MNDVDCVIKRDVYPQNVHSCSTNIRGISVFVLKIPVVYQKLEALERLYRSTGLIFLQWQKKFLTIIIQSLHFSSLKKKGMEKTCEKRRKKW